ncbi:hypothetical protein [Kribbella deserti]|uniref:Secreted protein n=1 Tax=Kribbella deserti TaxID=1926257 RepID=A0ABV6QLB9_9ACTN
MGVPLLIAIWVLVLLGVVWLIFTLVGVGKAGSAAVEEVVDHDEDRQQELPGEARQDDGQPRDVPRNPVSRDVQRDGWINPDR